MSEKVFTTLVGPAISTPRRHHYRTANEPHVAGSPDLGDVVHVVDLDKFTWRVDLLMDGTNVIVLVQFGKEE